MKEQVKKGQDDNVPPPLDLHVSTFDLQKKSTALYKTEYVGSVLQKKSVCLQFWSPQL